MDERIKKQRLSRRDFSNFPSIISRVIREIKYVFRILKRTKKYSVFFTSNDPPDSRRIRSEFPLKFRGYIEIEVEWCPGYYGERGGGNGYGEKAWRSWKASVERRVFMVSTEITREELFRRNIFARTIKVFGWGEAIGPRNRIEICQLFHLVVSLLYRGRPPLSYICRSGRNKRTDDYAPVKLIYAACLCTRAKPDCSNKRTTSDLTDIIYIYIYHVCVRAHVHTTQLWLHV